VDAGDSPIASMDVRINEGKKGDDGADAYHIALAAGFGGTVEQWLASLHGADSVVPGPKGDAGAAGTGKTWIDLTLSAYSALTTTQQIDATIVYNIVG